jgi:hypothetical protein
LGGEEMKRGRNGDGEKFLPRRHGEQRDEENWNDGRLEEWKNVTI